MRYSFIGYITVAILTWTIDYLLFKLPNNKKTLPKPLKTTFFLIIPSIFSLAFLAIYFAVKYYASSTIYLIFQYWLALYILIYFPKLTYLIICTLLKNIFKIANKFESYKHKEKIPKQNNISRRKFVSITGLAIASIPFLSVGYGITNGRFDFRKIRKTIKFPNLPKNFNGIKVVQFSDIHLGTFIGFEHKIDELVALINEEKADLLIFTGDIVNNFSSETDTFHQALSKLTASLGKIAILGNHDYGDYSIWDKNEDKKQDQEKLKSFITSLGFRLLLNESIAIHINDQEIGVSGVENWGHPPFPQYGNLNKASQGIEAFNFNILLTHDPDHWEAEVLNKKPYNLTLSGHTHGMQVGIEWGQMIWSPAKWRFKRWGGLYKEGSQYLYVNRGIGSIGLPARMGMSPEITVLTLNA